MEVSFVKLTGVISWPPLQDGRVSTKEFLEASKVILKFCDTLGKVYTPVKHDLHGNILKLSAKYSKDPERFVYIQNMIEHEVCNGENYAAESLLWLKRGLHFICLFLGALVLDHEKNVRNESLMENMKISYELSLKPYHNWVLQKLFVILSHAAPSRQELFRSMTMTSYSNEMIESNEEVISKVKVFTEGLQTNLEAIFDMYNNLKLDNLKFQSFPHSKQDCI